MFDAELPGKQPGRDRVGGGGHVAAVAQVVPEQGGDGLGNVEPVRAELEPGGFIAARDLADAQRGDPAGLLAVERDQAAGDAVFEGEGVIEQQPADRREPLLGGRPRGFGPGVDHGQLGAAEDALVAGPGQEGEGVLPGAWPGGEPAVKVVLGAFAELASAAGQPGQEGGPPW